MAVYRDFTFVRFDDGFLVVPMSPPQPVGGWDVLFRVTGRFGSTSGLIEKCCASGYGNGASGIAVQNSGQGNFAIALNSADTSGLEAVPYAYQITRLDSGYRAVLTEGYMMLTN